LRGSAGFAPASHSASVSLAYDHARTQFEKEQKQQPSKSTGQPETKSTAGRLWRELNSEAQRLKADLFKSVFGTSEDVP
jgi:hypothetical protein